MFSSVLMPIIVQYCCLTRAYSSKDLLRIKSPKSDNLPFTCFAVFRLTPHHEYLLHTSRARLCDYATVKVTKGTTYAIDRQL